MAKHTLGHWTVRKAPNIDIYAGDTMIAAMRFMGGDNSEGEANAALLIAGLDAARIRMKWNMMCLEHDGAQHIPYHLASLKEELKSKMHKAETKFARLYKGE